MKLFIMDVDGTLTDGKIYIGSDGQELKVFNVKDGYAIKEKLHKKGVKTAIITGRESEIVQIRAKELNIDYVFQNVKNKSAIVINLKERLKIKEKDIAYVGDDLNDIEAMQLCGIKGCPADAVNEIKLICNFISNYNGGCGAIREFVEWIEQKGL